MKTLPSKEAVRGFSDLLGLVFFAGERVTITRRGRPVAAMVTIEDLAQLQAQPPLPEPVR